MADQIIECDINNLSHNFGHSQMLTRGGVRWSWHTYTLIHHPLVVCTHQICCAVAVPIALSQDRLLHGHNRLVNWTPCSRMREQAKNSITYYIIAIYLPCGNAAFSSNDSKYQEWNVSNNMQPWWSFLTIILIPCLKIKSPNLGIPWSFHQRVPNLWMSCRLGPWQGTRIVAAAITAGRHVILKCKINHLYSWNYTHITSILWRTSSKMLSHLPYIQLVMYRFKS